MIGDHVPKRRYGTTEIECVSLVGNGVEQDSARVELPEMGLDRPDRILGVLKEMVSDDEVLRSVSHGRQPLAVVDDIHGGDMQVGELRIVTA
jgi:hypothetical protein